MILFKDVSYLDQDYTWQKHYDILIDRGLIKNISPHRDDRKNLAPCQVIEGKHKLVMPGFFNLHSHVPMTLLRGYGEGLNLQDWLFTRIFPFENLLEKEDMYWGALLGISEFLASGVVSFSDMYMRIQGIVKAVEESGIMANLCNAVTGLDPKARYKDNSSYKEEMYLLDHILKNPDSLIKADAGIHAEYTSSPELASQVISFAKDHDLAIQIHASETELEQRECQERHDGKTPIEYFDSLGALDQKCIFAHGVYMTDRDLEIVRDRESVLVHNPASNFKLGSGFANIRKWLDLGITSCLGTDGAASNNDLDFLQDMRLAALLSPGLNRDSKAISPQEILKMATINGAEAQNRDQTGLIKEGYSADLVLVDLDTPNMQPIYDLPANLVYSASQKNIYLTMVKGKILYQAGEYKTLDIERVKHEVKRIKKEKLALLKKQ